MDKKTLSYVVSHADYIESRTFSHGGYSHIDDLPTGHLVAKLFAKEFEQHGLVCGRHVIASETVEWKVHRGNVEQQHRFDLEFHDPSMALLFKLSCERQTV